MTLLLGCAEPRPPDEIPVGDYTYAADWLDWRLDRIVEQEDVPGISVALIDDQQVVYRGLVGVTDLEDQTAVDRDTVWRVGSVTKLFTALGVLQLVDDGALELDAPITDWLPDAVFPTRFEDSDPITIRHLLAHRSGLPRNSGLPLWYWEAADDPALLFPTMTEALTTQHVAQPPGRRFHYSNVGYNVLAQLTEAATGDLWVYHLQEEILAPIGMADSAMLWDDLPDDAVVAMGHADVDDASVATAQFDEIQLASGNLFSTVDDLATFVQWVFRDGEGLLDADTLWDSYEPQYARPRDPEAHGLGWETSGRRFDEPVVYHTGTIHGTSSIVALLPESRLGVVVVGNSDRFAQPANEVALEALERMLETRGTPTAERPRPERFDVAREVLDRYVGTWIVGGEPAEVWRKGGKLKVRFQGVTLAMRPIGEDRFELDHWLGDPGDIRVTFRLGEPDLMVVDLLRMDHQLGLRYDVDALPTRWHDLVGEYTRRPRVASENWDADATWSSEVVLTEEGVLTLPDMPLWPISDTELLVVGGQWDGETVLWDPEAQQLTHGAWVWTYDGPLEPGGCGCRTTGGSGAVWMLPWMWLAARRSRRGPPPVRTWAEPAPSTRPARRPR